MSWRIVLSDGRLWAIGADGWSGGFALSGTLLGCGLDLLWRGPRCYVAVIGRGCRAWCVRLGELSADFVMWVWGRCGGLVRSEVARLV